MIMMIMKWEGVTPDQYDKAKDALDWDNDKPIGNVFHAAGFTENAIRVTDVWESAEEFNTYVHDRLIAATASAGIAGQPQVEIVPLHNMYVPDLALLS